MIDLWTSKIFSKEGNLASINAGKPNFISPEPVQGNQYCFGIWSIGIIVDELMTFKQTSDYENHLEMIQKISFQQPPTIRLIILLTEYSYINIRVRD